MLWTVVYAGGDGSWGGEFRLEFSTFAILKTKNMEHLTVFSLYLIILFHMNFALFKHYCGNIFITTH